MPTTLHSAKFSKTLESLLEMVYMFFKFWLLADGSRDLSQAEKEITACKAEKIHKMATIFTQNDNLETFWSENCQLEINHVIHQPTIKT